MKQGVSRGQLDRAMRAYTTNELMEFIRHKDKVIADLKTERASLLFYIGSKRKEITALGKTLVSQRRKLRKLDGAIKALTPDDDGEH